MKTCIIKYWRGPNCKLSQEMEFIDEAEIDISDINTLLTCYPNVNIMILQIHNQTEEYSICWLDDETFDE